MQSLRVSSLGTSIDQRSGEYIYVRQVLARLCFATYYLLGSDTAVPSGLYARLYHAFLVLNIALSIRLSDVCPSVCLSVCLSAAVGVLYDDRKCPKSRFGTC